MIIYENKGFETRSDKPNEDWTGNAKYVLDDSSELAKKIQRLFPWYEFILDNEGNLIDVEEIEHEPIPEPEPMPTEQDKLEAQILYTAMMTDTLLMEE